MAEQLLKPKYVDPAGDPRRGALPVEPPFFLNNVTARVFPLRANMATLAKFCDQSLNIVPPHIVCYRPAMPYVYLMVLNYGSMSAASIQAQNVGWVAQHEVTFTVPLQRWREEDGRLVFKDWACFTPFIYVDDEISLNTGREVYGWPKVTGRVVADNLLWSNDPRARMRLCQLSTMDFAHTYAGRPETWHVLLTVDHDAPPRFSEFPLNLSNPWAPWSMVPNALLGSLSLMGDAADILLGLRVRGYRRDRSLDSLLTMGRKAGGKALHLLPGMLLPSPGRSGAEQDALVKGLPELFLDTVTLKQFRDAEIPNRACYQALINSKMGIDRLNHAGLLGDTDLLRGDPSGGFTVRIRRSISQPIIQSLGLCVAASEQADDGGEFALIKPVLPFWTDVDLRYGKGHVICSRGRDDDDTWKDEQCDPAPARRQTPETPSPALYNTALGAATQPITGPFRFPDVTLQVYPLLADRMKMDQFIKRYLNDPLNEMVYPPGYGPDKDGKPPKWRFEAFGSYVYLMVKVYGDQLGTMWSTSNNIGWWAEREVAFSIPVKWFDENDRLISVALIEPFVYCNRDRATATDREVNGRPSVTATIESPEDVWLTYSGPAAPRKFLHLQTEIFPALNLGQKAEQTTLLDIDGCDILEHNDHCGWNKVADQWGRELADDLKRKCHLADAQQDDVDNARALALEVLALGAPVNRVILKQYRDAYDLDKACYQALIHTTSKITRIYDAREIEQQLHVRLHRFPGHPIADVLGLKVKSTASVVGHVVENLQPIRPFWMRLSVDEELGTVACQRSQSEPWRITHPWFKKPPKMQVPSQPRTLDGYKPPFSTSGSSRVSRVWLEGKDKIQPRNLQRQAITKLHEALTAECESVWQQIRQLSTEQLNKRLGENKMPSLLERARLENRESASALWAAASVESLKAMIDGAEQMSPPLSPPHKKSELLARDEAEKSIRALDEVQIVIEQILSEEWENWGNSRWYQRGQSKKSEPRAKPHHCIPRGSVYGDTDVLQVAEDEWGKINDLKRFPENGSHPWWIPSSQSKAVEHAGLADKRSVQKLLALLPRITWAAEAQPADLEVKALMADIKAMAGKPTH